MILEYMWDVYEYEKSTLNLLTQFLRCYVEFVEHGFSRGVKLMNILSKKSASEIFILKIVFYNPLNVKRIRDSRHVQ